MAASTVSSLRRPAPRTICNGQAAPWVLHRGKYDPGLLPALSVMEGASVSSAGITGCGTPGPTHASTSLPRLPNTVLLLALEEDLSREVSNKLTGLGKRGTRNRITRIRLCMQFSGKLGVLS